MFNAQTNERGLIWFNSSNANPQFTRSPYKGLQTHVFFTHKPNDINHLRTHCRPLHVNTCVGGWCIQNRLNALSVHMYLLDPKKKNIKKRIYNINYMYLKLYIYKSAFNGFWIYQRGAHVFTCKGLQNVCKPLILLMLCIKNTCVCRGL